MPHNGTEIDSEIVIDSRTPQLFAILMFISLYLQNRIKQQLSTKAFLLIIRLSNPGRNLFPA
jgi:hypothetical protein